MFKPLTALGRRDRLASRELGRNTVASARQLRAQIRQVRRDLVRQLGLRRRAAANPYESDGEFNPKTLD